MHKIKQIDGHGNKNNVKAFVFDRNKKKIYSNTYLVHIQQKGMKGEQFSNKEYVKTFYDKKNSNA